MARLICVMGKIKVDIGSVKNPAYRTMYFRVAAE